MSSSKWPKDSRGLPASLSKGVLHDPTNDDYWTTEETTKEDKWFRDLKLGFKLLVEFGKWLWRKDDTS